ncbi:hypothetical protein [Pontibacter harenae]|uniref:hypothetical protein n=1 Tax=Pontibacter harenae TaxID=2894083 RepID=UPI001E2E1F8E|nr:hypothetical protein [Pontibacter harenae]MCC9168201.1 hypothetical protein [Pontibacter harenae]
MEFTIEREGALKLCRLVDITELYQGREHGMVYINPDGTKGTTLVSHCSKTDFCRYGAPNLEMVLKGWRPFIYKDEVLAA